MMINYIVSKLNRCDNNVILVFDEDNILSNSDIISMLKENGYDIYDFKDPDLFRYYFESKFKIAPSGKLKSGVKLLIRYDGKITIPYDIKMSSSNIAITLTELFPKLNYTVLKEMHPDILEKLYSIYSYYTGKQLSEAETKEYILKNIYGIVPEVINNYNDLIKTFVNIYYKGIELPEIIFDYFIERLNSKDYFKKIKNKEVFYTKDNFFAYLGDEWKTYLNDLLNKTSNATIDFGNNDIKVYIDNLFYEKYIDPVVIDNIDALPKWTHAGIIYDENLRRKRELENILSSVKEKIDKAKSYRDWQNISELWGESLYIFYSGDRSNHEFQDVQKEIEDRFRKWLINEYSYLSSASYVNGPVMLHHVPWYINYKMKKDGFDKVALLVFDGMSLDDWHIIKDYLKEKGYWQIESTTSFAWIPTLTSISRQSIFSGEIPVYFKDTLMTTNYEERQWKRFWMNQGLYLDNVFYMRSVIDFKDSRLNDIINNRKAKILGFVVDIVDKLIHRQILSVEGLYQDLKLWLKNSDFNLFLDSLAKNGYEIFITSDHGNIYSIGNGRLNEGSIVEIAGERVRVYERGLNYDKALNNNNAFVWTGFGLPDDYSFILSNGNNAFVDNDRRIITHGGASIEEVIVPFIHVRKEEHNAKSGL